MKYLILAASLVFTHQVFAEDVQDLSEVLAQSHCVPVRGADGKISGHKCDGPLGKQMRDGKFENIEFKTMDKTKTVTSHGEPIDTPEKAMELYNSMKGNKQLTVQRAATLGDKFRSCLADLYNGQVSYHKKSGSFSTTPAEFGLNQSGMCKGFDVSVDYANQTEFKVVAKSTDHIWSVDQTKTIEQIR